jgi:hypothetical protein
MGKIYVNTNHQLNDYQKDSAFLEYLKDENRIININDLDNINPSQISIIKHFIPRYKLLNLHTTRISMKLPPNSPKFQLQFGTIWNRVGQSTRFIMVKCDNINKGKVLQ